MSADGSTRPPDAAPPPEPPPEWHAAEDRVRDVERATFALELRNGPDYGDRLLDEGGFTRGAYASPEVHDYVNPPREAQERDGLSLPAPDTKTIQLDHDVWVAQYFDTSRPLKEAPNDPNGRSHRYWAPVDPADIPKLAEGDRLDTAQDDNALLPSWSGRDAVQIARIPAGTVVSVNEIVGQAEDSLKDMLDNPTDATGALRPELQPEHILENISDVRLGGADEILFDHFDDGWIKGWARLR